MEELSWFLGHYGVNDGFTSGWVVFVFLVCWWPASFLLLRTCRRGFLCIYESRTYLILSLFASTVHFDHFPSIELDIVGALYLHILCYLLAYLLTLSIHLQNISFARLIQQFRRAEIDYERQDAARNTIHQPVSVSDTESFRSGEVASSLPSERPRLPQTANAISCGSIVNHGTPAPAAWHLPGVPTGREGGAAPIISPISRHSNLNLLGFSSISGRREGGRTGGSRRALLSRVLGRCYGCWEVMGPASAGPVTLGRDGAPALGVGITRWEMGNVMAGS